MQNQKLLTVIFLILTFSSQAADWNDTEISILRGNKYHDNGNHQDITKTIVTLQHASGYEYGNNFFFVDASKSNDRGNRYGEVYGEYYHTLNYTKISKKDWRQNFVKDIGLTGGINYGAKNSTFGSNPEVYLLGTVIDLKVPGFLFFNVNTYAYMDSTRYSGFGGGYSCGKNTTTFQITPTWNAPFIIGNFRFVFLGFVDYIGKHGTCSEQILAQPQLRLDVGHYFGSPERVFFGVEYQYWKNKYGVEGNRDNFPQALLTWKL